MSVRRLWLYLLGLLMMVGCSSKKSDDSIDSLGLPYEVQASYRATSSLLDEAPATLKSFSITSSENDLQLLVDQYDGLVFNYDASDLTADARKFCAHHKARVDSLRQVIRGVINDNLSSVRRTLVYDMDQDFEDEIEYAFKVPKGTRIYVHCTVSVQASIRLYNKENNVTLRSWNRKKDLDDSVVASATAIYVLRVKAKGEHTLSLDVSKNLININELDKEYELPEDEE